LKKVDLVTGNLVEILTGVSELSFIIWIQNIFRTGVSLSEERFVKGSHQCSYAMYYTVYKIMFCFLR